MGFVQFAGRRVGFWIAERSQDPLAELPPGVVPQVVGEKTPDTRALVLCAIDPDDRPVWAFVLHDAIGAALVLPWGERLVAGLGETAVFLDGEGRIEGRFSTAPADELTGAATGNEGLALLARRSLSLVRPDLSAGWALPLDADSALLLEWKPGQLRLAAFYGPDWREILIDPASGKVLS